MALGVKELVTICPPDLTMTQPHPKLPVRHRLRTDSSYQTLTFQHSVVAVIAVLSDWSVQPMILSVASNEVAGTLSEDPRKME